VALDAHTGALLWQQPTDSGAYGSPAVVNGIVYNGSGAGTLYALNARTGSVIWKKTVGSAINGSPAVLDKLVYVSSFNGSNQFTLYALNVLTGAIYFQHPINDTIIFSDASPAPTIGGIVYVSSDSTIWALDALSGALHWKYSGAYGYGQSAPAGADNVIYVGSAGTGTVRSLYALDAGLGTVLWQYDFQSSHSNLSSPVIANGVMYVGTGDGYLIAFHLPGQ
jgi:serine/threonine-protein kinase